MLQDWFTNVALAHPHLVHVLPCELNRQTSIQWLHPPYEEVFEKFHSCPTVKVRHLNGCGPRPQDCKIDTSNSVYWQNRTIYLETVKRPTSSPKRTLMDMSFINRCRSISRSSGSRWPASRISQNWGGINQTGGEENSVTKCDKTLNYTPTLCNTIKYRAILNDVHMGYCCSS